MATAQQQGPRFGVVTNQKGGVGKSTITMNLAACLVYSGRRTLVVDCDPQKSTSTSWARRSGDKLPFDWTYETDIKKLAGLRGSTQWDEILVDTPGSLEALDLQTFLVQDLADRLIVPMEPAFLSFDPTATFIKQWVLSSSASYKVLISKSHPNKPKRVVETRAWLTKRGFGHFTGHVRDLDAHESAPAAGLVCTQYNRSNSGAYHTQALSDFQAVALEYLAGQWAEEAS